MTQYVLLILRENEPPRIIGPFVSELTPAGIAGWSGLQEGEFLIQPLEPPPGPPERGRHALIPSPVPRDETCLSCGEPYLPTHSSAAPGMNARHSYRSPSGFRPNTVIVDEQPLKFRDLAAGGRPITEWIEGHADELRRFAPLDLPKGDTR